MIWLGTGSLTEKVRGRFPTRQGAFLACALAMSCNLFWAEAHGQDNADMKQRFLNDAPEAWEKFHHRAKRLQGSFSVKVVLPGGEVVQHAKSELKQSQGCALFLKQYILTKGKDTSGSIRAANPHYAFELRKADETKGWTVPQVALDPVKSYPFDDLFQKVEMWANMPITLGVVSELEPVENKGSWRTIIKEPGFSVKTVVAQAQAGKPWAKVEFEYQPNGKSQRVPSKVTGWAVLAPERHWSIQEYDIHLEWAEIAPKVSYAAKYKYADSRDGFPVLKAIDIRYENPQKSYKSNFPYEFDLREGNLPTEDFTLSAFGFPEPVGVTWPKPTRWWLWISMAAVGSVALAIVFWKLKRRFQNPGPGEAKTEPNEGRP